MDSQLKEYKDKTVLIFPKFKCSKERASGRYQQRNGIIPTGQQSSLKTCPNYIVLIGIRTKFSMHFIKCIKILNKINAHFLLWKLYISYFYCPIGFSAMCARVDVDAYAKKISPHYITQLEQLAGLLCCLKAYNHSAPIFQKSFFS